MTKKWDVVVVGGGLAGFVAAAYLAKTDLSVIVLEKGARVGGRATTTKMKNSYFNLGPHALSKKGPAVSILNELGVMLSGSSPKVGGTVMRDNVGFAAPFSPAALLTTRLFSFSERVQWMKVLGTIMATSPKKLGNQTLQQWVQQVAPSANVREMLYTFSRLATYCHVPEQMSAKVAMTSLKQAMGGVLYVDYGWMTLIDQLHQQVTAAGVEVQSHRTVTSMEFFEEQSTRLVLSDGEEILARDIIWTAGPQEFNKLLGNDTPTPYHDFLSQTVPVRGATLDVALTKLPDSKQLFALDMTNALYYSVHSTYARLSENPDHVVLHVLKYHRPEDSIDRVATQQELEQFLDLLQPNWQNHVVAKRFLPDVTINQRLPRVGEDDWLRKAETPIPGLYVAGDWTSPDYLLADGAVSSGKRAAQELILNEKRTSYAHH